MTTRSAMPAIGPLTPVRDAEPALGAGRAFCERLICVRDEGIEPRWWLGSADEHALVFHEGGRISECIASDLQTEIEASVDAGYRPVVLAPDLLGWTEALRALGRYEPFGAAYARGRDDAIMSMLLHGPSLELLNVYYEGGRVIVPNLDYAKALDAYLPARFEDFVLERLDQSDPLRPSVRLTSRLNPFRHIALELDCASGTVHLHQYYLDEEGGAKTDCDERVPLGRWMLDFSSANPLETVDIVAPSERLAFAGAIAEALELPLAYRDWEREPRPPWRGLLERLDSMGRGVPAALTPEQQALLALVELDTLERSFGGGEADAALTRESPDGVPEPGGRLPDVLLLRMDEQDGATLDEATLMLRVRWLAEKPLRPPEVIVEHEGKPIVRARALWSEDRERLTLADTSADAHDSLGWICSADGCTLRLFLGTPRAVTAVAAATAPAVFPTPRVERPRALHARSSGSALTRLMLLWQRWISMPVAVTALATLAVIGVMLPLLVPERRPVGFDELATMSANPAAGWRYAPSAGTSVRSASDDPTSPERHALLFGVRSALLDLGLAERAGVRGFFEALPANYPICERGDDACEGGNHRFYRLGRWAVLTERGCHTALEPADREAVLASQASALDALLASAEMAPAVAADGELAGPLARADSDEGLCRLADALYDWGLR